MKLIYSQTINHSSYQNIIIKDLKEIGIKVPKSSTSKEKHVRTASFVLRIFYHLQNNFILHIYVIYHLNQTIYILKRASFQEIV